MKKIIIVFFIMIFTIVIIFPKYVYAVDTLDKIMKKGDDFLNEGSKYNLNENLLKDTSNSIYNILLGICMILAVIIGMILGIKYMTAESEDKAAIKETLIPFVVACVIMFSAFTIWKIVIEILT